MLQLHLLYKNIFASKYGLVFHNELMQLLDGHCCEYIHLVTLQELFI